MPAKNSIKIPIKDGYYHVYNRGVNKQNIFENNQDYAVFLNYLKEALSPNTIPINKVEVQVNGIAFLKPKRQPKNFCNKLVLIAYVLMPNHFHLLIKQNEKDSMEKFMRSISTRYSMYFNKVYKRIGPLFQGVYKAVNIEDDNYLLHLSRYIHLNPKPLFSDLTKAYSSYPEYLGVKNTVWLDPHPVLDFFENSTLPEVRKFNEYKNFVEEKDNDINIDLSNLIIEK